MSSSNPSPEKPAVKSKADPKDAAAAQSVSNGTKPVVKPPVVTKADKSKKPAVNLPAKPVAKTPANPEAKTTAKKPAAEAKA